MVRLARAPRLGNNRFPVGPPRLGAMLGPILEVASRNLGPPGPLIYDGKPRPKPPEARERTSRPQTDPEGKAWALQASLTVCRLLGPGKPTQTCQRRVCKIARVAWPAPPFAPKELLGMPRPPPLHTLIPGAAMALAHYPSPLTISGTFDSLFKVLFIVPSRYLFAIGLPPIYRLGWSLPPD